MSSFVFTQLTFSISLSFFFLLFIIPVHVYLTGSVKTSLLGSTPPTCLLSKFKLMWSLYEFACQGFLMKRVGVD